MGEEESDFDEEDSSVDRSDLGGVEVGTLGESWFLRGVKSLGGATVASTEGSPASIVVDSNESGAIAR